MPARTYIFIHIYTLIKLECEKNINLLLYYITFYVKVDII